MAKTYFVIARETCPRCGGDGLVEQLNSESVDQFQSIPLPKSITIKNHHPPPTEVAAGPLSFLRATSDDRRATRSAYCIDPAALPCNVPPGAAGLNGQI